MSAAVRTIADGPADRHLRVEGRPDGVAAWAMLCRDLAGALRTEARVRLELHGGAQPPEALGPAAGAPGPAPLVEAAEALRAARQRLRAPLLVKASGVLSGPLLVLALGADVLVMEEDMAAEALFWEDSRLLVPGELRALSERLGRSGALRAALFGDRLEGSALGGLRGDEGRGIWDAAGEGSLVAEAAAARLLRGAACRSRAGAQAMERAAFALCFDLPDRSEGVAAFRARRAPEFPSNRSNQRPQGKGPE